MEQLTVPELKEECRRRGVRVSGKKGELIERLLGCGDGAAEERPAAKMGDFWEEEAETIGDANEKNGEKAEVEIETEKATGAMDLDDLL